MFGTVNKGALAPRFAGVRIAQDATIRQDGKGEPNKVVGISEVSLVLVAFYDERGAPCHGLYFRVGDDLVSAQDTVEWCGRLKPMSDWMRRQVDQHFSAVEASATPPVVAQDDSVSVLAEL